MALESLRARSSGVHLGLDGDFDKLRHVFGRFKMRDNGAI